MITFVMWASFNVATEANAQNLRNTISNANLGSGYAHFLHITSESTLSSATYDVRSGNNDTSYSIYRLPWEASLFRGPKQIALLGRFHAGFITVGNDFELSPTSLGPGTIAADWYVASASGGLGLRIPLVWGLSIKPSFDAGLARLESQAKYFGSATNLQPLLDGLLFRWKSYAYFLTPSLRAEWERSWDRHKLYVTSRLAGSWMKSFAESDEVVAFSEPAYGYNLRGEWIEALPFTFLERTFSAVFLAGFAGFFGPNRDVLGFSYVGEVGGGMQAPIFLRYPNLPALRVSGSYLRGDGVSGWTIGASLAS